jgi:hypothetical protein
MAWMAWMAWIAWMAGMLTTLALAGGCMEARRSLGEDCLKDDDCLSRTCLQLRCVAAPPTTDARATIEAASQTSSEPPLEPPEAAFDGVGSAE